MKNTLLCLLLSVVALSLACGGALANPMPLADCNAELASALAAKCSGGITADCRKLSPQAAQCQSFERADVNACSTNARNATDCAAAQQVACSIRCTNY